MEQVLHPVAPAAGPDKISRSGGCSTAWLVRAGSWMAALPVSRRVMSHHPGHNYQAHPTWTVASKDWHLSRGNSVLSCGEGRDSARHSHVPVSLSVSKAYSQCHDPPSSSPTYLLLPTGLWHRLVTPGDRVGLGYLGKHCPGLRLGAGLGVEKGGWPGTFGIDEL